MNKILKFSDYQFSQKIAQEFLEKINTSRILESDNNSLDFESLIKDILDKFGFNLSLVFTFGTGVKLMFPVVHKLIENMNLEIKPTHEDVVLLCITCISIMYLENKKNAPISADDIKNKLNAEIQMKFGNPRIIVNKILKCFNSIFLFIKKFPKLFGVAVSNIVDMFGYTTILLPCMNAISSLVGTYQLTPENLAGNLLSLASGIMTMAGSHILKYITNKKNSKSNDSEEVLSDVDDLVHGNDLSKNQLIREQ